MKELIKQLILDFQYDNLPQPKPRQIDTTVLPKSVRKAYVYVGMRRTGKTWLMFQRMQDLLSSNHPKEKILYLNFEDDRLLPFKADNFQDILSAYFELYPEYANDAQVTFFFDEIHVITGWEKFIRRLLDKENMSIFITGSSAKMLSKEIATSLRGRAITCEVFPLSYGEYLAFKDVPANLPLTSKNKSLLLHHCYNYLESGGFPEVLFVEHDMYKNLLQDYVNAVVFRDIVERYHVTNPHVVKLFLLHCLHNIAAPLSITKVYQALKSNGVVVGKNSLYEYLSYFEEAYLLYAIPIFDFSVRKQQVNPKKIYTNDSGIISAYTIKPEFDKSSAFENAVFLQLRRQYRDIFYYKTNSAKEVDFVVVSPNGQIQLFQACLDIKQEKTRLREMQALIEAASELEVKDLFIVTLDNEEVVKQDEYTIYIVSFWKWAKQWHD